MLTFIMVKRARETWNETIISIARRYNIEIHCSVRHSGQRLLLWSHSPMQLAWKTWAHVRTAFSDLLFTGSRQMLQVTWFILLSSSESSSVDVSDHAGSCRCSCRRLLVWICWTVRSPLLRGLLSKGEKIFHQLRNHHIKRRDIN